MRMNKCSKKEEKITMSRLNKVISIETYRIIIYVEERIKKRSSGYQY